MNQRKSEWPILPVILNRWSPRAMSDEIVSQEELMPLFEAARWAPSSYNAQLWRFVYAKRGSLAFIKMFNILAPFNQSWVHRASYLILTISRNNFTYNNEPSRTHSFDTGAAWQNFALQGYHDGLVVHGMEGFDYNAAKKEFLIPDEYTVEMMIAIGKPGPIHDLPEELQQREIPSQRQPIQDFVFDGIFKK